MQKTVIDQFSPFLFTGVMVVLVGATAWYAFSTFSPKPADAAEEDLAVIPH